MEQQYESNFYIAAMQSITALGAATIRDLVNNFGGPYESRATSLMNWKASIKRS